MLYTEKTMVLEATMMEENTTEVLNLATMEVLSKTMTKMFLVRAARRRQ